VIDALFKAPVFSSAEFYEQAAIPRVSGAKILKDLEENDIIQVLQRGAGRRASMYAFACSPSPRGTGCEYSGTSKQICGYRNPDPISTNLIPGSVCGSSTIHNRICGSQDTIYDPQKYLWAMGDPQRSDPAGRRACGRGWRHERGRRRGLGLGGGEPD